MSGEHEPVKIVMALCLLSLLMLGCRSLHDGQGWEHMGDPQTHQDEQPYVLKHEH